MSGKVSMVKFQRFKSAFNVVWSETVPFYIKSVIQCLEHAECIAIDIFDMLIRGS